ncbi:MAG TPA: hypothetical protein VIK27_06755 [Candidatus Aquilonibacter sp.]
MYFDRGPAEAAVDRLHGLGYSQDDIGVMMDDKTRERAFASLTNVKGSEGVATGATIGGVLGAIIAGLTATGSVAAIAGTGGLAAPLVAGAAGGGILIAVKPHSAEHRAEVRRALAEPRTSTGELDRSVEYAGEIRANPNRV